MLQNLQAFIQKTLQLEATPDLEIPAVKEFGHYSSNLAMRLAKERKISPLELAKQFAKRLQDGDSGKLFSRVEAIAPGFINFWLSEKFLQQSLTKEYKRKRAKKLGTVIVEYSAPNIAKPMHVGHLRSTIIGDALSNIYEFSGYKVIRWNYLGDWGTQFGRLIAAYKLWGNKAKVKARPIPELLALYIHFHQEIKNDPLLEKRGQEEFKKLEAGDRENRKLWEWFRRISVQDLKKMYKRLGVRFTIWRGESYYEKDLTRLVKALLLLGGDFVQRSAGSLIFPLDKFNLPPALLQKSDGASLYLTRDIASLKKRISEYKPKKILYVVGNEQSLHFDQLFTIAHLLKLGTVELQHIKYGLVLGEDGKKLSTREGTAISLETLLDEATKQAGKTVATKNPKLSKRAQERIAEMVGIGALKYNDLKEHRQSDIRFNWQEMLNLQGDTAVYLQYTYARLVSILKKAKRIKRPDFTKLSGDLDLALLKKRLDFEDTVAFCIKTNLTTHLAKYAHGLAKLTNQFYETEPILKDTDQPRAAARLKLIQAVAETLKQALQLLGIQISERI